MHSLAELQRQFYVAVTQRAAVEGAEQLVGGSPQVALYRRMYCDRIVDALAAEFPKTAAFLGGHWAEVATEYVYACPPSHPDLRFAGMRLATFLAADAGAVVAELAALEWARSNAFHAADSAALTRDDLAAVDPVDFPALRFGLVAASELLDASHDVDAIWSAIEDEQALAPTVAGKISIAVWRRDTMTVVHRVLDADEAAALRVVEQGGRFADVCAALVEHDEPATRAVELLLRWIDAQLLRRTERPAIVAR